MCAYIPFAEKPCVVSHAEINNLVNPPSSGSFKMGRCVSSLDPGGTERMKGSDDREGGHGGKKEGVNLEVRINLITSHVCVKVT